MKALVIALISLTFLNSSLAASRKRVNTKKIEKKYWTSKGYKTGVVQGRSFFKEKRLKLSFENVTLLNDKYSKTDGLNNFRLEASYYLSERFSLLGFYENLSLKDNSAVRELRNLSAGDVALNHVKIDNFIGGGFEFVPIYSKLSWMNKKIIYLDFSISPKVGLATYEQQVSGGNGDTKTTPVVGLDFATNIFINNNFSVNLAYRTRAYQAEVLNFTSGANTVADSSKTNLHNFFTFGINYFF